jgi:hypothetical protein
MKIFFDLYRVPEIIRQNKSSQHAQKIQPTLFFKVPRFFWVAMIFLTFIYGHPKNPKPPESFRASWKKMLPNLFAH